MKQKGLLKTMLLLCALIVGSASVWADTAGFSLTSATTPPLAAGETKTTTITGTDSETWNVEITGTWTSSSMAGSAGSKIWQMGKNGAAITSAKFSTSGITGTITSIVVRCSSYSAKAKVNCTVGGVAFGTQAQSTSSWETIGNVTFSGSASGTIEVTLDNSASGARAVYIQSITVTYTAGAAVAVTGVSLDKTSMTVVAGESETLNATIAPADATNKVVSWESDDTDIATVSSTGVVTGVAEGTATITVTTDDGDFTATCAVTVTKAPIPAVTLDFTSNTGWGIPEDDKTTGTGNYKNGGYTITLYGPTGNGYYYDSSNNNVLLGKSGAYLALPAFSFNVRKIRVYGASGASGSVTFNVFVGDEAVSTSVTSSQVTHDFAIAAEKQAAGNIYVIKVTNANNMRISKIEVFGYEDVTITAAKYATYCPVVDLDFSTTDVTVYKAKVEGNVAKFTEVTDGLVKAGEGVILYCETADTYSIPATTGATELSNNELVGVTERTQVDWNVGTKYNYILQQSGSGIVFNKATGAYLTANRAYLSTTYNVGSGARELAIEIDGETTGIDATFNDNVEMINDNVIYDLSGRRVENPTKGIYIINGKKVVIR